MNNFIKKVSDGKIDDRVKAQFIKFSRGEFKDRAIIEVKKSGSNYSISTSYEYANEFVENMAHSLKDKESVEVTGAIVSTRDLSDDIEYKDKKQFQGVKRYLIDSEMKKEQIINLCEKFPKSFIALSFKTSEGELKIKPKAPKSGKPGKGDEEPKADFCKLKTTNKSIVNGLLFDVNKDFKKIRVSHDIKIDDIIIPKEEKDPAIMREKAVRKGVILRKIKIDDDEIVNKIPFEV